MKKIILQGLITILLFFGLWFVIRQINWVKVFRVQQVSDQTEQKLGDLFWEVYQKSDKENKNIKVIRSVDQLVSHICASNHIDRESIKVHILDKDEVNAFALPNGHLIVYSGLILMADKQEELAGVLCHEIAHIELKHVMKKLIKEIGLSVLVSITTGNSGGEVLRETAKVLSSSAFDRSLEKEADLTAIDFLTKAHLNPAPFADFLYKLSDKEQEATKYFTWVSTHPDSKDRAAYIISHCKDNMADYKPILSDKDWRALKEELAD